MEQEDLFEFPPKQERSWGLYLLGVRGSKLQLSHTEKQEFPQQLTPLPGLVL